MCHSGSAERVISAGGLCTMYSDSASESESGSNSVIVNPAGLMCQRRPSIVRCRVVTKEGVAESRLRAGSASARWKEAVLCCMYVLCHFVPSLVAALL
jgi:hypothetical protein